jgi:hypothetical protein
MTILGRPADQEMIEGYRDGLDLNCPEPSSNRSHSYRHGFANGRDDRKGKPRASFEELTRQADGAMMRDDCDRELGPGSTWL